MIYIDASVALAHLFLEDRRPPADFWDHTLAASRLIEYEVWTVLHARAFAASHGDAAAALLGRIALLELSPPVLTRALGAFPVPVRTLDALHLASADYLPSADSPSNSRPTINECRTRPGRWVFRSTA